MTRSEWVQRYVSAMKAGGSELPERHLIDRAADGCDASEQAGDKDPENWEVPEIIAEEHLEADRS